MKNTQIEKKSPAAFERPTSVSFFPVVEDYVNISRCLTAPTGNPKYIVHLFRVFLFLNVICFPAYLIFDGYAALGLSIFAVSFVIFMFLMPDSETKFYNKYFAAVLKDYDKHQLEVELTEHGVRWRHKGNESLVAWKNITAIQENSESIYFFQSSSGIAVRKSAFGSAEQKAAFVEYARQQVRFAKAE